MSKFITRFPLSHFSELEEMLAECFPEFWLPRFKSGKHFFPYDLKLFIAKEKGRKIGSVGIHEYNILCGGKILVLHGLCDVSVVKEFRRRGYARLLQEYAVKYCTERSFAFAMPLYTTKPDVYRSMNWNIYMSDRSDEMTSGIFPKRGKILYFNDLNIDMKAICGRRREIPPGSRESAVAKIFAFYNSGRKFEGKVMRSFKVWDELFSDGANEWIVEENRYFLYRGERLLEAYSPDAEDPVSRYTPAHGGHDGNFVMVKILDRIPDISMDSTEEFRRTLEKGKIVFPAADTF